MPAFVVLLLTGAPSLRRGRRGHNADLLEQSELVPAIPVLNPSPAFVEAGNDHHAHADASVRRRDAEQAASVRALQRERARNPITFGHNLLDRAIQVRDSLAQGADERFQPIARGRQVGGSE